MTRVSDKHRTAELLGSVGQLDPAKLGTNSGGAMSFANRVFEPYPGAAEADSTQADEPLPDADGPRVAFRKGKEAVVVAIGSPPRDLLIKRRPLWKDFRYLALCSVYMVLFVGLLLFGLHYYGLWERMHKQQKQNVEEQMALQAQLLETKEQHLEWQRSESATWKEHIKIQQLLLDVGAQANVTLSEQLNDTKNALDDCNARTQSLHDAFLRVNERSERTNEENLDLRNQLFHYERIYDHQVNSMYQGHADQQRAMNAHIEGYKTELEKREQKIRQLQTKVDEQAELIGLANSTRQETAKLLEAKDQRIKRLEMDLDHMMKMEEKIENEFEKKVQEHVHEHLQEHYSTQAEREQHINALFRRMEADMHKVQDTVQAKQRELDTMRAQCCSLSVVVGSSQRVEACIEQHH